MKDHEINQAIAESVGGGYLTDCVGGFWFVMMNGCKYGPFTEDLNAMHEVEKTLTARMDQDTYVSHLVSNLYFYCDTLPTTRDEAWVCRHSTARQCAEAYLRTIGKWRDA